MRNSAANADVLSTREAAERLGVALRTVQLWVESGVLPAWKTAGGHRRISRAAVERLLVDRRSALQGAGGADPLAPRRPSLLVVEDDAPLRQLYTEVITTWALDLDLRTAGDGFEALLRIGQDCPDLLVTDLRMPGMDGFRMIEALQQPLPAGPRPRIVVVTALDGAAIAARGGLPADVSVFGKPLAFDALEAVVREHLGAVRGHAPPEGAMP